MTIFGGQIGKGPWMIFSRWLSSQKPKGSSKAVSIVKLSYDMFYLVSGPFLLKKHIFNILLDWTKVKNARSVSGSVRKVYIIFFFFYFNCATARVIASVSLLIIAEILPSSDEALYPTTVSKGSASCIPWDLLANLSVLTSHLTKLRIFWTSTQALY